MTSKQDLEDTIKDKVAPLLEEIMEKNLGVIIPKVEKDLSDKLTNPLAHIYIPFNLPFQKAKKTFKKEFLRKELTIHFGNISNLAKTLGLDRRSLHRAIKEFKINIDRSKTEDYQEKLVHEILRETFDLYRSILRPEKIEQMYGAVPNLSRNIAKILPHQEFTWKEIELEFEKQFLGQALKSNSWKVSDTAKKIEIRVETLHRKIRKLGLRKTTV